MIIDRIRKQLQEELEKQWYDYLLKLIEDKK
jgi:hypothetical protein